MSANIWTIVKYLLLAIVCIFVYLEAKRLITLPFSNKSYRNMEVFPDSLGLRSIESECTTYGDYRWRHVAYDGNHYCVHYEVGTQLPSEPTVTKLIDGETVDKVARFVDGHVDNPLDLETPIVGSTDGTDLAEALKVIYGD